MEIHQAAVPIVLHLSTVLIRGRAVLYGALVAMRVLKERERERERNSGGGENRWDFLFQPTAGFSYQIKG